MTAAMGTLLEAAEQGDAKSQFELAMAYRDGRGVQQNYAEAAKWCRKAADQGITDAQYNLGSIYDEGKGVIQDYAEAVKWYRKAADQGNADAQNNLGKMYGEGRGITQDYAEAMKWYGKAAVPSQKGFDLNRDWTPPTAQHSSRPENESSVQSSGTGFFITSDGYLLTSLHVIERATRILVRKIRETYEAGVVKTDTLNDVAVLKVSGVFKALPLASSRKVKLGDSIFTIGFPNPEIQGLEAKLTRGEINSLTGIQDDPRYFQISSPVQPGNSGGPVVDQLGNAVGIVTMRLNDLQALKTTGSLPQNVNYALKSSFVLAFLETVPEVAAKFRTPDIPLRKTVRFFSNRRFGDSISES